MNDSYKEIVILAIYTDRNKKKHYSVFRNIEEAKRVCPNGVYQQVPFYTEEELSSTEKWFKTCKDSYKMDKHTN